MAGNPSNAHRELVDVATTVARSAGALLMTRLAGPRTVTSKTTPTDLVSDVDRAAEDLIVGLLRRRRPDDGLLGEEGTETAGTTGLRWVVDPIDGTTNYLYRAAAFSVSVAVEDAEGPLVGVVLDPQRDELFAASRGGGATRNGSRIRCSTATDVAHALIATGFSYDSARRRHQAEVLVEVLPQVRDIRRSGSAALDWCGVACGRVDAVFERGQQPWDYAAGSLIAAEAGATVGDLRDGPPSPEMALGAAPDVFAGLRDLLVSAQADRD
ncbi:MAG TPA: inositol monophosphatase family protein [Mycobacteriales bacterium]|nr:inositol monophosphatase family protein [Mycobacteriales bacterium]